jgi:tetratricopeptide (TPR) repeat protein
MQHRMGSFLLLAAFLAAGPGFAGDAATPDAARKAATRVFQQGDLEASLEQHQSLLAEARRHKDADGERAALLGLARTQACLGDKTAAEKTYEELWRTRTAAVGEGHVSLYWDAIDSGFAYNAMGNTAKARQSFQRAVAALDKAPQAQGWFADARLLPRWMMLRAGDAALEPAVRKGVGERKGSYSGVVWGYLKIEKRNLKVCGWDRQAADIDAFARELGFDKNSFWNFTPPPTR